jgi:hypothetical protein
MYQLSILFLVLFSKISIHCLTFDSIENKDLLDLSSFGSCTIHIKEFSSYHGTKEINLIEEIIFAQKSSRSLETVTSLFTVYNSTLYNPEIGRSFKFFEPCSLNVILGFHFLFQDDFFENWLLDYIENNNSTFSMTAIPTTHIVFPNVAHAGYVNPWIIDLPINLFIVFHPLIPSFTFAGLSVNLDTPVYLISFYCRRLFQPMKTRFVHPNNSQLELPAFNKNNFIIYSVKKHQDKT